MRAVCAVLLMEPMTVGGELEWSAVKMIHGRVVEVTGLRPGLDSH